MLNPCEHCGSCFHSTDVCTPGHLEVELIRASRSDERNQSLLWDLIAAIDADGCKRLHAEFPPTGSYAPIVASAIEKIAGLRAELAALRSEVEGDNGLRASCAAGWAIAKARLEENERLRQHQFGAAIEALRAKPPDCHRCGADVPETPPGHIVAGCFPPSRAQPSRHPAFTAGVTIFQKAANWLETQAPKPEPTPARIRLDKWLAAHPGSYIDLEYVESVAEEDDAINEALDRAEAAEREEKS
jgi:hypothetical protein